MTAKEADKRANLFVRRYPPKKMHALPKEVLMRDAFAKGLMAAGRPKKITKAIRLKLS